MHRVVTAVVLQTLMLFVLLFFIAFFSAAASEIWTRNSGVHHWYLALEGNFVLNYTLLTVVIVVWWYDSQY